MNIGYIRKPKERKCTYCKGIGKVWRDLKWLRHQWLPCPRCFGKGKIYS